MNAQLNDFRYMLRNFESSHPEGVSHFANAHFVGLYSIVIDKQGDCLTRCYVARPGELHPDLQYEQGRFLWHAHGYHFMEKTIAGHVENICVRPGHKTVFNEYQIFAGIDSGQRPTLKATGRKAMLDEYRRDACGPGMSFTMHAETIHRVVFRPCFRTGWFACVVKEIQKVKPPEFVYSPHVIDEVPDADKLYQKIPASVAAGVVRQLNQSLDELY